MAAAVAPSPGQEDEFYAKILGLRDAAIAGTHPTFKLPADAIEQLKASLLVPEGPSNTASHPTALNGVDSAYAGGSHAGTNQPSRPSPSYATFPGLSFPSALSANGLPQASGAPVASSGLDPIFLEKSDSLVRAEGQLKRQRIERDLLDQAERHRGHASGRDKELLAEALSTINIDSVLAAAQKRVKHVSGLKPTHRRDSLAKSAASSFDENDYYSSQAGSDWSADSPGRRPDDHVGAFTANFEHLEIPSGVTQPSAKSLGKRPTYAKDAPAAASIAPKDRSDAYSAEPDGMDEADDEDEEYSPPDPAAFDSFREEDTTADMQETGADDDSEYEPGELAEESTVQMPYMAQQAATYSSPQGPIIRNNHLTHIAAPQPNRVSPLAVQKHPSIELELVNGCPVVKQPSPVAQQSKQSKQKGIKRKMQVRSRASSGSPPGKKLSKKQKGIPTLSQKAMRKQEQHERRQKKKEQKSRQDRQDDHSPPSPMHREPFIKPEPVSPQPFASVPEVQQYGYGYQRQTGPIEILDSPQHAPQPQYVYAPAPRHEYVPQAPSLNPGRISSPAGYRPVQRDTQDLRRVASLHFASRPASPAQAVYSPVAQYPRHASVAPGARDFSYREDAPTARYQPTEIQAEPLRFQEYRESSPAMMPPPAAAPRRIVVDQYGNRYYAAEPVPNPRASVAPVARAPEPEIAYDRAPSRLSVAYAQPPQSARYEPADSRMAPPPLPSRRHAPQGPPPIEYIDPNRYRVREYSTRPAEPARYSLAPTSPVYQQSPQYEEMPPPSTHQLRRAPQYEQMPPPPVPQPPREPTSPVYAPPPRAFSVRPDGYEEAPVTYAPRQASVAPVQYVRQEAPPIAVRSASVAPGAEYGAPVYQERAPSYAPQPAVRYVDEYGREVMPRELRQASQYGY